MLQINFAHFITNLHRSRCLESRYGGFYTYFSYTLYIVHCTYSPLGKEIIHAIHLPHVFSSLRHSLTSHAQLLYRYASPKYRKLNTIASFCEITQNCCNLLFCIFLHLQMSYILERYILNTLTLQN